MDNWASTLEEEGVGSSGHFSIEHSFADVSKWSFASITGSGTDMSC